MPAVFGAECSSCGHIGQVVSDGYRAVFCDTPLPTDFPHSEDPYLAILHHPGEQRCSEAIERHLAPEPVSDRWVTVEKRYCQGCGHLFEIRRLVAPPQVGCRPYLIGLGLCAAVGIGAVFWFPLEWPQGCGAGLVATWASFFLVTLALGSVDWWLTRIAQHRLEERQPDRVRRVNTPHTCPQCGADDSRVPGRVRSPIPCVNCGERTAVVRCVGKS